MIAPWRFFPVEVARLQRLSTSFLRVTLAGDQLDAFADNGFDQRIKVILPLPEYGVAHLPTGLDWHAQWRALPEHLRNPVRTYTVRAARLALSEVDIDMVLHSDGNGPAARWAVGAQVGDKLALLGPDARYDGSHGGIEFRPPASAGTILLAGDEAAVPAIASIVERMPAGLRGEVVLEVPYADDVMTLQAPPGIRQVWQARNGAPHGSLLEPAVKAAAARLLPPKAGEPVQDVDVDNQILWEVPEEPAPASGVYAWLAGEAGVIRTLRRHLVTEQGLDRRCVAFMGYWRLGRAENTD